MSLLGIDEFRSAASTARRRMLLGTLVALLTVFAYFGVIYLLAKFAGVQQLRNGKSTTGLLATVGVLPVFFGVFALAARWAQSHPHLKCPHCRRSLAESAKLVIATRNCPHCGRRVLAEPD
jgi:hypothetical protein